MTLRRSLARVLLAGSLVAAGLAASTSSAIAADFHLMKIREVGGGHPIDTDAEFVELQMYSPGQTNLSPGHTLTLYGSAGTVVKTYPIPNDVTNGANQATILFAHGAAETAYGVQADFQDEFNLNQSGGAVCFDMVDCVAWGAFTNLPGLPVGTPADAIPIGSSLERSITASCPTALDAADDTGSSAADFAVQPTPNPEPNSAPPNETTCTGGSGGGGGAFTLLNLKAKVKGGRATISGRIDPPAPGDQVKLTFFANGSPLRKVSTKTATLNGASEFKKRFKVPSDSTRCKVVVRFRGTKMGQKKFRC